MKFSPFKMKIILHYYCSSQPYSGNEPKVVYNEAVKLLVEQGILDRADFPKITERGKALVELWLEQPLPVSVTSWIDPRMANQK